ncbi:MAG: nuclear transport factor 2 family protein [Betaproteobacteria bacterium]
MRVIRRWSTGSRCPDNLCIDLAHYIDRRRYGPVLDLFTGDGKFDRLGTVFSGREEIRRFLEVERIALWMANALIDAALRDAEAAPAPRAANANGGKAGAEHRTAKADGRKTSPTATDGQSGRRESSADALRTAKPGSAKTARTATKRK